MDESSEALSVMIMVDRRR